MMSVPKESLANVDLISTASVVVRLAAKYVTVSEPEPVVTFSMASVEVALV